MDTRKWEILRENGFSDLPLDGQEDAMLRFAIKDVSDALILAWLDSDCEAVRAWISDLRTVAEKIACKRLSDACDTALAETQISAKTVCMLYLAYAHSLEAVCAVFNQPMPKPAVQTPSHPNDTLLVADDDVCVRRLYAAVWGDTLSVVEAADGREVLDTLRLGGTQYVGLLMDLYMPIIDGKETLRQLQLDPELRKLPTVAVTGMGVPEDDKLRQYGATGFLRDPQEALSEKMRLLRIFGITD